eukprot:TRINITY_DN2247_c0_g1_i1.p1 TRINITY_DN2247_c0_g1~~TRINITY_DN2247_c0_g1_i1.p1  ORF type:complete len:77 (-),score=7.04 TRINITY_DN2247_c0_g1_i1:205-435(-)
MSAVCETLSIPKQKLYSHKKCFSHFSEGMVTDCSDFFFCDLYIVNDSLIKAIENTFGETGGLVVGLIHDVGNNTTI